MHVHVMQMQIMRPQYMRSPAILAPAVAPTDTKLVDAWRDLLAQHARAQCALERALKEHDLGVSEYEVLERLAGGDDAERRMQDLGAAAQARRLRPRRPLRLRAEPVRG